MDEWKEAYAKRPLSDICSKEIDIEIVGERCVYINDFRVAGRKPYVSERLPIKAKKTTIREVLSAFSDEEIHAYLEEKIAINNHCAGLRNYRDAANAIKKAEEQTP